MSTETLVQPDSIAQDRIDHLVERGIDPMIAAIDLEMVKMKLAHSDPELGWSREDCDAAEVEYKRFLHLILRRKKDIRLVPSKLMDTMWHYHILDTHAYHQDTLRVFGKYLHHFPYLGLRGANDKAKSMYYWTKTQELYEDEFGESMTMTGPHAASGDCTDSGNCGCGDGSSCGE